MSLREKQEIFARTLGIFLNWMAEQNYTWTMGDCYRSEDELLCPHCGTGVSYQQLLKYNGRSKVTQSKHNLKCAIDITLFTAEGKLAEPEAYRPLAEKWESLGGRAGFRFGVDPKDYAVKAGWDAGHFEGL
jgi:hypothetical protein